MKTTIRTAISLSIICVCFAMIALLVAPVIFAVWVSPWWLLLYAAYTPLCLLLELIRDNMSNYLKEEEKDDQI